MVSQTIRVKFSKNGRLIYISHLDLCRTMRTILKRAKLPVKYTEGFNPHLKMTFALPLSLGVSSDCEFMDLVLCEPMSCEEASVRLHRAFPLGLSVEALYEPQTKLTDAAYAAYEITLLGVHWKEALTQKFSAPIFVEKRKKDGTMAEMNLCDSLASVDFSEIGENTVLYVKIPCANGGSLNPEYVAKVCGAEDYQIRRTHLYFADGVTDFA